MADDFGLRIGIEGEKQFKDALREINQSFKVLGSEMTLVTSQFDKNDNSIRALTSRNEVLNREIDQQRQKVETLRSALENASTSFGENDRRTQNWQIQLNKAQAELNGMEREISRNNDALQEYADGTDESADTMEDATRAAGELADSVDQVGDEMEDSGKKTSGFGDLLKANLLSEAIVSGIKAIGSAIVEIGKSFAGAMQEGVEYNAQMESYTASFTTMLGDQAKAQQLVNDLKKEAAATPFGMRDLADAAQTLMGFGLSAEDAQKHMKQLGDISQGNADRFSSLTLAFAQISSTGKLTGQDLMQMINAGFNPLDEISRTTGQSIAELKEQMSQGAISADMLADALESATSEGGRFYGSMEAQSQTFSGQMATLEDGVAALKGQLSEGLTSMLSGTVLPMVNGWVNGVSLAFATDGVSGLVTAFGDILREALAFLSEQLPLFVSGASQIALALTDGLVSAIPTITQSALQLVLAIVDGIVANLPSIANAAVQMVTTLIAGIGSALPELIPVAIQSVAMVVQTIIENLPLVLDAALQIILGLTEGILAALPQLIAALPAIITAVVDFIIGAIPQIMDAGIQLLVSLVTELPTIIRSIVEAIPQIITSILAAIMNSIPQLVDAGVQLLVALIQNLPLIIITVVGAIPQIIDSVIIALIESIPLLVETGVQLLVALVQNLPVIITGIVAAIPPIITAILEAITSRISNMVQAGENLIKGLWQGISNVKNWIMDKIRGFMDDIVDGMKRFFGICSPSTVFADIGQNLGLGIGVGFETAMEKVSRDMQNAIPTSFDLSPEVRGGIAGSYGAGMYPSGTNITQNISITSPKALSEKEAAREFRNLSRKLALGV